MVDGRQDPPKQGGEARRDGGRRRRRGRGGSGHKQTTEKSAGGQRPPQAGAQAGQRRSDGGRPPKHAQKSNAAGSDRQRPNSSAKAERKVDKPEPIFVHVPKRYGIAIYDTLAAARADIAALSAKTKDFDQLNIVIRAEANMDDPELNAIPNVKVFAGTAWALIHDRRLQDGWYEAPR